MRVSAINALVLLSSCLAMPVFGQLSSQDAAAIWNNFNANFYSSGTYKWQEGGSYDKNDRWENAEMLEMATDCYIAAPTGANENTVSNLFNAFDSSYGSDWTSDEYNDDIMWCVLAHARAYLAIYNETKIVTPSMTKWAVNASNNFCWVYNGGHSPGRVNPQYDNNLGGGMWWTNNSNPSTATKNSCVNGPAALAAFYLNLIYPNAGFKAKGTNMIYWETTHLVTLSTGYLYDHITSNGLVTPDISYNVGTYVGAAGLLGVGIPETVAEYFTNTSSLSPNDILKNYGTGGQNNDGFNGIFLRWVGTYEILSGNTNWNGFFNNQAKAAWAVTNASGLSWDDWLPTTNTPASGLYSWDCSPSVVALQWAQIAQSKTAPLVPLQESLTFALNNGQRQLNWIYGTLQSASTISGPYTAVPNASPPYTIPATGAGRFYRVRED